MLVLLLIPTILLLASLVWMLQWTRSWRVDRTIPVLSGGLPFVRHSQKLIGDSSNLWKFISAFSLRVIEKGGLAKFWFGPMPYYLVTDPDIALKLTNACLKKIYIYKFASSWIGEGLLTSDGSTWRRHRKLLNPTFNQHILDGFLEVFNRQSELLTEIMAVHVGKGEFDPRPYLADNALETVCKTLFGMQDANENLIDYQYKTAVTRMLTILINRLTKVWLHPDFIYKHTSAKKAEDETVKVLKNMSSIVIQRKKALFSNSFKEEDNITEKGRKFKTFLEILLEMGERGSLTEQEIREEVDTMIAATHDTSPTAIMFTLVVLGSFPEVQQNVYEEIIKVMGNTERDVEKEDLAKLVYTEAVIKETLRLYPVAPVFARRSTEDVRLDDKHIIPKDCAILILVYGIHRSKCWGDDAHVFKPERWLEPETLPTSPGAFAAFSLGRRVCIGKSYAMMSMKINLAYLLRRYKVTADHTKMKLKFDVVLKPASGHFISIEERI